MIGEAAGKPVWNRGTMCESGGCVEIALMGDAIIIRSSLNLETTPVTLTRKEWEEFVSGVKEGAFDHL